MIVISVNGKRIDLYKNTKLTYKNTNPIFCFDKYEVEHSYTFKVPTTTNNQEVFECSNRPDYIGMQARTKLSAQIVDGITVRVGYIVIMSATDKDYSLLFVEDGNEEIRKIKAVSDISTQAGVIGLDNFVKMSAPIYSTTGHTADIYNRIRYHFDGVDVFQYEKHKIHPSLLLNTVVNRILENQGINLRVKNTPRLRFIPKKLNTRNGEGVTVILSSGLLDFVQGGRHLYQIAQAQSSNTALLEPTWINYMRAVYRSAYSIVDVYNEQDETGKLKVYNYGAWTVKAKTRLYFPDTFPSNYYIISHISEIRDFGATIEDHELAFFPIIQPWVSPYSYFDRAINVQGSARIEPRPLAGQVVELEEGAVFSFVNINDIGYSQNLLQGDTVDFCYFGHSGDATKKYTSIGAPAAAFTLQVSQVNGETSTTTAYAQDNMPKNSLMDILRTYAYVRGEVLNYGKNGFFFDNLEDGWEYASNYEVVKVGAVKRVVKDYARNNFIQFKADPDDQVKNIYQAQNDTQPNEKILFEIPFRAGARKGFTKAILRTDEQANLEEDYLVQGTSIAGGGGHLSLLSVPNNSNLEALLDISTTIEAILRIAPSFMQTIHSKSIFIINHTPYAWVDYSYDGEFLKITLIKYIQ